MLEPRVLMTLSCSQCSTSVDLQLRPADPRPLHKCRGGRAAAFDLEAPRGKRPLVVLPQATAS